MKQDKKTANFAKKLVELSKDAGVVTEAKVSEVLAGLKQVQPRHTSKILKQYLVYIRREIASQTAVVASPGHSVQTRWRASRQTSARSTTARSRQSLRQTVL